MIFQKSEILENAVSLVWYCQFDVSPVNYSDSDSDSDGDRS